MQTEQPSISLPCTDPLCDELVIYPVEMPLYGTVDTESGNLTLETTVQRVVGDKSLTRVRLNFSADAAHQFVDLLRVLQDHFGVSLGRRDQPLRH